MMRARPSATVTGIPGVLTGWVSVFVLRAIVESLGLSRASTLMIGDALTYLLPIALGALGALYVVVRVARSGGGRRFWSFMAAGSAVLLAAETYWTWYAATVDPAGPPYGGWLTQLHVVSAVSLIAAMAQFTLAGWGPWWARWRYYVDLFAGVLVAWLCVYLYWTLPLFGQAREGVFGVATVAALYPVLGLLLAGTVATVIVHWSAYRWREWERLTAVGIAIFASGLIASPLWTIDKLAGQSQGATWYTGVLACGYVAFFGAAVSRVASGPSGAVDHAWPPLIDVAPPLRRAYPLLLALATPLLAWPALSDGDSWSRQAVLNTAMALSVLLVFRSWLLAVERSAADRRMRTDPVTGAYSSRMFRTRLSRQVQAVRDGGESFALALLDVGEGWRVRGALDRASRDDLLMLAADAVRAVLPASGELFRLGDDQFAVVLPEYDRTEALRFADRLAAGAERVTSPDGFPLSVAVGVAVCPDNGTSTEEVLTASEAALSVARAKESRPIAAFDGALDAAAHDTQTIGARTRAMRATLQALAKAVDARSPHMKDHSANVSELATGLAQVLGLSDDHVQTIGLAALLHDVGKIGFSDEILSKTTPLDASERTSIEEHSDLGVKILTAARLSSVLPAVRHHHERWDGGGYPSGLSEHDIPLEARILAVCDAFETMTAGRPYRPARSVTDALAEVEACSGSQFDPVVASAFIRMVEGLGPHIRAQHL